MSHWGEWIPPNFSAGIFILDEICLFRQMTGNVRRDNEKSKGEEPIKKQLEEVSYCFFGFLCFTIFLRSTASWCSSSSLSSLLFAPSWPATWGPTCSTGERTWDQGDLLLKKVQLMFLQGCWSGLCLASSLVVPTCTLSSGSCLRRTASSWRRLSSL